MIDSVSVSTAKVKFQSKELLITFKDIRKGHAEIYYTMVRTGAICKDGTRSKATGRGACSHHGGVARWITERNEHIRIVD